MLKSHNHCLGNRGNVQAVAGFCPPSSFEGGWHLSTGGQVEGVQAEPVTRGQPQSLSVHGGVTPLLVILTQAFGQFQVSAALRDYGIQHLLPLPAPRASFLAHTVKP